MRILLNHSSRVKRQQERDGADDKKNRSKRAKTPLNLQVEKVFSLCFPVRDTALNASLGLHTGTVLSFTVFKECLHERLPTMNSNKAAGQDKICLSS